MAADIGHSEMVTLLLENGADVNQATVRRRTPTVTAVIDFPSSRYPLPSLFPPLSPSNACSHVMLVILPRFFAL